MVLAHVDKLGRLADTPESRLGDGLRFTGKSDHGAVGSLARVNIEQRNALDSSDSVGNVFDNLFVAALAEIGHTFNYSFIHKGSIHVCHKDTKK